jgi:hypothetical protein
MRQAVKKLIVLLFVILLTISFPDIALTQSESIAAKAGIVSPNSVQVSDPVRVGSININNLWLRACNDGRVGYDSAGRGLSYPFYNGNLLYSDNIFWVGKVNDGNLPEIRTGGGTYRPGVRPGMIINKGISEDPLSESVRVFRYRPDYQTGNLTLDAAALNGVEISKVTPDMVTAVRENYKKDLAEWPWQKGAPFIDKNHNGQMDAGENPGLENASQVLWFSYNDLDEAVCKSFAGDPPIGLEIQVTLWAYKGTPNLDDVVFKRYRLIYKGSASASSKAKIDSMFLTQWADPDIGSASNDLGGCDSLLDLAYGYNATYSGNDQDNTYKTLGLPTPGLGYAILQGPLVPGKSGDVGVFDFVARGGSKNLPMTSCGVHITGVGDGLNEPINGVRSYYYWNVARGYQAIGYQTISSNPWLDHEKKPTKFMYYGDPVSRSGWIAARPNYQYYQDYPGGDLRLYINTGPFTMALGDTQEVVIAMIASAAPTSVENATWLKNRAKYVRAIYPKLGEYVAGFITGVSDNSNVPGDFALSQNFPNPFNPSTQIRFTIPHEGQVKLSVFDLLGREAKVLYHGFLPAGEHTVAWDGRNASGESAPSGVYFYRLTHGDRQVTRKLLLIR